MSKKPEVAVSIKNIHKEFILPQNRNTTFKQTIVNALKKNNKVKQKVLDGVTFDVNKGDFFGIVGRNGSGKSTLLKLIAGVYTPNSGDIALSGGLTPFIELGVGFNPELSGRDNVFLNGALLGYSRKQMQSMYDEIVAFAELEPFMDQKLKNYSSGMQVRLAFSIAIMAKNDILIFDEVLAVGDEAFQSKCYSVFEKYKAEKQTVILVTHDMGSVKNFCNRAVFIENGKVVTIGDPYEVADRYSQSNRLVIESELSKENQKNSDLNAGCRLRAKILPKSNGSSISYRYGEKIKLQIDLSKFPENTKIESVAAHIFKKSGEHITGRNSRQVLHGPIDLKKNKKICIDYELNIQPGMYGFYVDIFDKPGSQIEFISSGLDFIVKDEGYLGWDGLVDLNHEWDFRK